MPFVNTWIVFIQDNGSHNKWRGGTVSQQDIVKAALTAGVKKTTLQKLVENSNGRIDVRTLRYRAR